MFSFHFMCSLYLSLSLIVDIGEKKTKSKKSKGSSEACGTCRECDSDDDGICSQLARRILVGVTYGPKFLSS